MKFLCNRRSNNTAVWIAIYCSILIPSFTRHNATHISPAVGIAACLVLLAFVLAAWFVCRSRKRSSL